MRTLETERLVLRPLTPDDAEFMLELLTDPSWLRFIGDRGVRTVEDARVYIQNGPMGMYERHGFGPLAAVSRETGEAMGTCGLIRRDGLDDVDIGYAFLPRFWGRGYAIEAARAVLASARDVPGLDRVVAITTPDNESSARLLERLGLRFERFVRIADDGEELRLFAIDLTPTK
jgi:RimJ/RimL family protein N-acetyltransferase